jgi:dienelactone hydrolase
MWQVWMIPALVVILSIGPDGAAGTPNQAKTARARELLHFLIDGNYKEFADAGCKEMKAAMGPKEAEKIWTGITSQIGPYRSEVSAKLTQIQGFYSVQFVCRCERGKLTLRVVVDGADRLSGLWIDRVDREVAYSPPGYVDTKAFREEKVTVSAGQFPLPGTLTLPKAAGPHPAVVLVHGSGPHDEDETVGANKPFRDLAWGLATRGLAVLRYEKRTHKYPTATRPADWTLDTEMIDDALAAADLLRKRSDIDAKRVYIAGHSLGAFVAPFIARRDSRLAGVIVLAANARPILDVLQDQLEYLAGLNGAPSEETQERLREAKEAIAAIRAGRLEGTCEKLGMPAAYAGYVQRLDKLNAVEAAAKLEVPILILQGRRDYQVTTKEFALWKKSLGDHKNVTFRLYDGLNHLFIRGEGPSTPAEYDKPGHVDKQVVADIAAWIERQVR